MAQRVTIVRIRRGSPGNVNEELQWLGNSLGLFGLRDRDSSCFRIFIILVKSAHQHPLSSDEIAERLRLSRGTVVHHLSRLMDTGMVVREKEGYVLREQRMQNLIRDLRQDINTMLEEIFDVARDIDEKLG